MGRRLQSIYEYFHDYSVEEINRMLEKLSESEKALLLERYGQDLYHPVSGEGWNTRKAGYFYNVLIPKMRNLLEEARKIPKSDPKELIPYIIDMIFAGKTNQEICKTLQLDSKTYYELLLQLKNKGFSMTRKYYSDASIKQVPLTSVTGVKYSKTAQDRTIITEPGENDLKFLLLSDLHFGSKLERLDATDKAIDYCVGNNIHIILCGGDMIDGTFNKCPQKISDIYKQIEYFITHYPKEDSIITIGTGGDHDVSAQKAYALNLQELCENYRPDIVIGGYNNVGVNIKNDQILLYHHIDGGTLRQSTAPLIVHGHSHRYETSIGRNQLNVTIPSMSDINTEYPSALEMNVHFENGMIERITLKHINFETKPIVLSESEYRFFPTPQDYIRNEEIFRKVEDAPQKVKTSSAIDKFNKRYGFHAS